mmetsp:Transcript_5720/g.8457  ORF Transcript_5720/g.8457 Transcript_5720/m.8457 type:complete len:268 (+) Transcript_5720:249-1052(+)
MFSIQQKKKERQVLLVKERTDNLKRQTTEKQKKANALVQAETERKMAIARKMAGGEKQGKLAREQLVQEREEQRLAELEQKLHLQNMQAAARAEAIKQDKIKSAKKTLSKQEAGKERAALLLEQKQNETLKSLGDRQERATLKAENEAHTKKMKAQAELEKVKSAKKNKSKEQSSFIQDSPSADFFNSPHDTKSITTSNIQNKSSSIDSTESTESITPMPRIIDLLHVDNRTVSSHEEEEDDDQKDSDDHPNNLLRSKEDTRCFFFC